MEQIARSATQETWGYLNGCVHVLHDRDTKFSSLFRSVLAAGGVKTLALPARSPNLNAFAERWVRSVKEECLSRLILFGERSLCRTLVQFGAHYHSERNHQGKGNKLLFRDAANQTEHRSGAVECRQRLGGLLKFYARAA
jgi:putative transposase